MRASRSLFAGSIVLFTLAAVACGDSGSSTGTGGSGTGTGGGATTTTGTGGSTTTTTTTTTTTGTGGGPLSCTSMVTNIPSGECDLFQQDCPNSNQTCTFVQDGSGGGGGGGTTTACQTANGLVTLGLPCASDGECAAGLFCIGDPGKCTPACCPDNDQPCGPGQCNLTVNVNGGTDFFMACTFSDMCTLFDPNSCVMGEDCHLGDPGAAFCSQPSGANLMEGEACVYVNDCGDMQNCIGNMTDGFFCRYLCEIGSSAAPGLGGCPAGQTCDGSFDTGFTDVGACLPN